MAETIVNLVLGKLADLDVVVKEVLHLYSVNNQVEKIDRELKRIQAFHADRKQITDRRQTNWVKAVRDVAHSIEDVIDNISLMEISQNPQNIVDEINQIQEKIKEIEESRIRYGINRLGEASNTGDVKLPVRPTVLPDIDSDIVAFKPNHNCIVKELLDETTKRCYVVSICGTGGLGKTTLAQKVYNCNDVKGQLGVCMWVAISETFRAVDVSRKIALKLGLPIKLTVQPNETKVILIEIHKILKRKKIPHSPRRCLDNRSMDSIWCSIPDENNGSRVVVTTRFAHIPKGMDPISEPYKLQFLTEKLSRELLLKTVSPKYDPNKSFFDDLSDIIDQFVHKCGGLPLALVVLGGISSKKPCSHAAWSSVFRTISWHVEGLKDCSEIIGTSYDDLSFALKSCFMYFVIFPKDYTISAQSLLRMWILEGFIPQEDNRTLEETAESFLEDLVQRSMVQVDSRLDIDGSITTVHMHNLLRDVSLQKAEEENFLLVYSNSDDKISMSKARRVAIHNPDFEQLTMSPNLYTLLFFYNGRMPICSKQRLLKVVSNGDNYKDDSVIELGMFVD